MKKNAQKKQTKSLPRPVGSIPFVIISKGVEWRLISASIDTDTFIFKGSNGKEHTRKWGELQDVLTTHQT